MANSLQVATINGVGDFILFLGKLAVGIVCGAISILLLRHRDDIHFYMIPCLFIGVFAFLIAHVILSLYEVTALRENNGFLFFASLISLIQTGSFSDGRRYTIPLRMRRSYHQWTKWTMEGKQFGTFAGRRAR